jgi:preprotein translocase subunit SecG
MELLITLFYILFILSAIVLVVVILLQEGKGGGLTSALGTSGQQTFGVGASGINKFTGWTGAIFLVSALAIHYFNRKDAEASAVPSFGTEQAAPAGTNPAGEAGAPPPAGGQAPPAGGQTPPPQAPPQAPPK